MGLEIDAIIDYCAKFNVKSIHVHLNRIRTICAQIQATASTECLLLLFPLTQYKNTPSVFLQPNLKFYYTFYYLYIYIMQSK